LLDLLECEQFLVLKPTTHTAAGSCDRLGWIVGFQLRIGSKVVFGFNIEQDRVDDHPPAAQFLAQSVKKEK
jgi:beta-lactamase class D